MKTNAMPSLLLWLRVCAILTMRDERVEDLCERQDYRYSWTYSCWKNPVGYYTCESHLMGKLLMAIRCKYMKN